MSHSKQTPQTKRLAADVPTDVFWEIKAATANAELKMREMIPLAVIRFLNLDISADRLGFKEYLLDLTSVPIIEPEDEVVDS